LNERGRFNATITGKECKEAKTERDNSEKKHEIEERGEAWRQTKKGEGLSKREGQGYGGWKTTDCHFRIVR